MEHVGSIVVYAESPFIGELLVSYVLVQVTPTMVRWSATVVHAGCALDHITLRGIVSPSWDKIWTAEAAVRSQAARSTRDAMPRIAVAIEKAMSARVIPAEETFEAAPEGSVMPE